MFESSTWSLTLMFPHQNPVYKSPLPTHATCFALLILLHLIAQNILDEKNRSLSSSLCSFFHSPVTSSLLGPNILLSTLFSNTLSLHSSLSVRDDFSPPYKTIKYKIIVLYILLYLFLDSNLRDKRFCQVIASPPSLQSALNFFLKRILIC